MMVMQGTVETGNQEDKIRLGFVALILNLACNLYDLDPEKHCKQGDADKSEPTSESIPNKSPKQVRERDLIFCNHLDPPRSHVCHPPS